MKHIGLIAGASMAIAAAGFLGGQLLAPYATLPREPRIEIRDQDPFRTQRQRNRLNKKLRAKIGRKRAGYIRYPANRPHPLPERSEGQLLVERMTNWQRSQWARAGYPGLGGGHVDTAKVRPFAELRRLTATASRTIVSPESLSS